MTSIPQLVREAYDEYLDWIQNNPRVRIPERFHDPEQSIGKVHASSIGRCAKANALKRKNEIKHSLSTKHLMQQGVRDAEPLQEAMLWKYPIEAKVEETIEYLPFRGRLDIQFGEDIGIEIKRRDGFNGRPPQPKLSDVYQMLVYSYIGLEQLWLCLMTRFDLFFWELKELEKGFVLVDENGDEWKSEYNKPSYLNYTVIMSEAVENLQYLNGEREDDPIPNFLAIPKGAECFRWENEQRPKRYKTVFNGAEERTANIVCHCPFFEQCKKIKLPEDNILTVREIEHGSKKYHLVV